MNGVPVSVHQSSSASESAEIRLHHGVAVARGGLRNRAHVDHGVELAAVEPRISSEGGTKSASWRFRRFRHLPSLPSTSQTAISVRPASLRLATIFDPINPAPPVTNSMLFCR